MRPSFGSGASTASRVPSTMPASPRAAASQAPVRATSSRPLCMSASLRVRKRVAEARFELRRQADLGNQHQRLLAALAGCAPRGAGRPRSCRCRSRRAAETRRNPPQRARPRLLAALVSACICTKRVPSAAVDALQRLSRQRLGRAQPRRQRSDHGFAERALVIAGKEAHQRDPVRRKRRRVVAQRDDRLDALGRELRLRCAPRSRRRFFVARRRARRRDRRRCASMPPAAILEELLQRHVERYPTQEISRCRQGLRVCG